MVDNNCAPISLDWYSLVQSDDSPVALTPAQSRVVLHMHLILSGRCSRRAGRDGLSPIRIISRCTTEAQFTRYHSSLARAHTTIHTCGTTQPSHPPAIFCFLIYALHWSLILQRPCCFGDTMASTPSVKGKDVEMTVSPSFSAADQKDELALARLGKKAVLKVSR